jgi:hypothetical protein
MADETVFVQVTAGPYRDKRLQMTKGEADKAVAEGWAYLEGENIHDKPEAKELTAEEQFEVDQKANEAARRMTSGEGDDSTERSSRGRKKEQPDEDDDNEPVSAQHRSTRSKK